MSSTARAAIIRHIALSPEDKGLDADPCGAVASYVGSAVRTFLSHGLFRSTQRTLHLCNTSSVEAPLRF